jgi:hypothetical protein
VADEADGLDNNSAQSIGELVADYNYRLAKLALATILIEIRVASTTSLVATTANYKSAIEFTIVERASTDAITSRHSSRVAAVFAEITAVKSARPPRMHAPCCLAAIENRRSKQWP